MRGPRPLVALVGRPNVGKSTLFNRLVGRRAAIVVDVPGVTRGRNYRDFTWDGRELSAVDTGGFEPEGGVAAQGSEALVGLVQQQAQLAIDEASAVILVVDGREGPTAVDRALAELLRRSGKPLFVAANKVDSEKAKGEAPLAEFYELGFGEVHPVSAEHGRGVGELVDAVVEALGLRPVKADLEPEGTRQEEAGEGEGDADEDGTREIRLAIVGRPNVGKSTLVNALLQENRFVVSEVPGTTRDSIDSVLEVRGQRFVVTDTAGIRRKRSIAQRVEQFSVIRAMRAIDDADVVAVVLDAMEAGAEQDARLAGLVLEKGRAPVLVVNKWDLAAQEGATQAFYTRELKKRLPFASWAPLLFVSAREGIGVERILSEASRLAKQYRSRLPTHALNELLEAIQLEHPAPLARGRPVKLYYVAQVATAPPTFVLQCSRPEAITDSYRRFVENRLRETFHMRVPLRLVFRERKRRDRPPPRAKKGRGSA